jgi:hypothetical protein
MPPIARETILICPKPECNREGFLRKKYSRFHLPQKNKIDTYYDLLKYISALFFNAFSKNLSRDDNTELNNLSIEQYNFFFTFYPTPKNQIEEFELNAIKSIIQKYSENCNIFFSKDLQESNHIKDIIYHHKLSKNHTQNDNVIYITREKLIILYSSLIITALQRCSELHKLGIEEDFEKEMVEKVKSVFYYLTLNLDKRNKFNIHCKIIVDKNENKFELKLEISKPTKLYTKCSKCKTEYPPNYKSNCKCGFRVTSIKPSKKHEKNKKKELDEIESNFKVGMPYFVKFMDLIKKQWFNEIEIEQDFQQFFDKAIEEVLEELEITGKTYYTIRHYDEKKSSKKKDCYISKRSQFMEISIKLKEYNTLIKNLVKAEVYGIGKNGKKIHFNLIAILRKLNFPERYILSKINHDSHIFGENYGKKRYWRMKINCIDIAINTLENSLIHVSDPMKLKYDIESIPKKCINLIIKKKLIPSNEIDEFNSVFDQYNKTIQEIPKEILYKNFFPTVGIIDSIIKAALSPFKLNLL